MDSFKDANPTRPSKLLAIASVILLGTTWILSIMTYQAGGERVPSHFNANGSVDGYAGPGTAFILPVFAILLYLLLSFVLRKPSAFNYIVPITSSNVERQQRLAIRLLESLRFIIQGIFLYIVYIKYRIVSGEPSALGGWFIFAIIGIFLVANVIYVLRSWQNR